MKIIHRTDDIELPEWAVCSICGAKVIVDDIDEWEQMEDGNWQASEGGTHINCSSEPDIRSEEWARWFHWHWDMPYVDWLPLGMRVYKWLSENYRFDYA